MFEKLFYLVSFVGAIQGVLLAAIFFAKKGNHPAIKVMAAYVVIFSVGLLEPFLEANLKGWTRLPVLYTLSISNLLYGPLLYLFVYYITSSEPRYSKRDALHVVPFALLSATVFWFLSWGIDLMENDIFQLCAFELVIVQILAYNVTAIRRLKSHREAVLNLHSFGANDFEWLRSLLIWITGTYLISFFISHLILFGVESAREFYLLVQISITLVVYAMTYRLILQPNLFLFRRNSPSSPGYGQAMPRYSRSGLKANQADAYLEALMAYMQQEKPYLDPDLSIHALSEKLNISRNHLTQVINEKLERNFYAYVNEFRVEEAKKMILDPQYAHLNLAGIGLEAGFKSKTSFNINFKKLAGVTPTEWKRAVHSRPSRKHVPS